MIDLPVLLNIASPNNKEIFLTALRQLAETVLVEPLDYLTDKRVIAG